MRGQCELHLLAPLRAPLTLTLSPAGGAEGIERQAGERGSSARRWAAALRRGIMGRMAPPSLACEPPLRIGLSCSIFGPDPERPIFKGKRLVYLEQSILDWAVSLGALAYPLPPLGTLERTEAMLARWLEDLDGVVLTGGTDVAPQNYGEQPLRPEWSGDPERDVYELALVRACLQRRLPLLGICRGAQLLNVALGGTLYQDIATQLPGAIVHRDHGLYDQLVHEIELVPGSRLAALYPGRRRARVNSVHHQAIKELAPGLVIEAVSAADGLPEAVRLQAAPGQPAPYAFAVQWHPEFQPAGGAGLLPAAPLLEDFLAACRGYRAARRPLG
ncbi:MAG: hypothetical protein KatS3mg102_2384 [Planctomycetota bacterium]|nr:MAG: hypothetical protein KatS3mg102_2384 [Planctomycetota bacterium]